MDPRTAIWLWHVILEFWSIISTWTDGDISQWLQWLTWTNLTDTFTSCQAEAGHQLDAGSFVLLRILSWFYTAMTGLAPNTDGYPGLHFLLTCGGEN